MGRMRAALRRLLLSATGLALLSGCRGFDPLKPPVVIEIVRTISSSESVSNEDYEQIKGTSNQVLEQIQDIDPQINPQLNLSSRSNFVQEIRNRTRSGFGPDLIITDSDTALELYRHRLVDPIEVSDQDRENIPSHLFELATAPDGALVGQPVNQFVQLACFNKDRLPTPPSTLEELERSSVDNTFGMAIQLKDLFWSVEAFDASTAMEASLNQIKVVPEQQDNVTQWLRWLVSSSYQQNIRFMRDQRRLRKALIQGDLDWITCWSSNLKQLKEAMNDSLGVTALPAGPTLRRKATTRLQVWSLGRNSSPQQRQKALVMLEFISKPWAQKTYALNSLTSMPVNRKAAAIVASKIPGGTEALKNYAALVNTDKASRGQKKARVFRDPVSYELISDVLLDTIYDTRTPEEATDVILSSLRESAK